MKVFKFGGASVKDAKNIKNVAEIIKQSGVEHLVVVVSAMGKTTNLLELVVDAYFNHKPHEMSGHLKQLKDNHQSIIDGLFSVLPNDNLKFYHVFNQLLVKLEKEPSLNYDFEYDQIIGFGELFSSSIVSEYFNSISLRNTWIDARNIIRTDEQYRDAGIDWELTNQFVSEVFKIDTDHKLYITQGFIGSSRNNLTTSLGREGSDYTAAIIGHVLNAESVTIWKDVPGVLSADPTWYPKAVQLRKMSYWEAVELTYFGAKVIHPKTLKPLQNKQIPLVVKSFVDPQHPGTVVEQTDDEIKVPVFIIMTNQTFITISPTDFSFIMEDSLAEVFSILSSMHIKINLMQQSALNFSICIDKRRDQQELFELLKKKYMVRYNEDVELVTVRHYNSEAIDEITKDKVLIDSQVSRKTARYVMKASPWKFN